MNRAIFVTSLWVIFAWAGPANGQTTTMSGTPLAVATIYSIGVEWPIVGDSNHNASATVSYRAQGTTTWNPALPLVRVDYDGANTLAGSVLFLTPATTYEVALSLTDPDGGSAVRTVTATTRPLPSPPVGGRTFHVVPGSGGGDGSPGNPFKGIAAAQSAVQPGDTVLLHGGNYGGRIALSTSGSSGRYLIWKAYGDGEVTFAGLDISGSFVWVEAVTVRDQTYGLAAIANPTDVVVRRSSFLNNHYAILMEEGGRNWYIADNTIVGDTPYYTESLDGEGIELNMTGGHTVAHNSISNVADGISDPGANTDLFGNDIFDTSDDGIEADNGGANVRMWRNRIHNAVHNGISFQPQTGAPWYIIRNQIVLNVEAAFKFRQTDRFVLLHNTIVNWGNAWPGTSMMCCNEDHLLRAVARNNLWVSVLGGQIWGFDAGMVDWRTDLDYDGIDWGQATNAFEYGGAVYSDIPSLTAASGLEPHGVRFLKDGCFETFDVPNPPPAPVPPQAMTLKPGCVAVDRGVVLPNVNDATFTGSAPDLGAYERGLEVPVYGPRAVPTATPAAIPGTIEAERFDEGGANVGYHDGSTGNSGGAFRSTDVDIEATSDAGEGYNVGWIDAGEWLQYTVDASTTASYTLTARVANTAAGGSIHVEVDGTDVTGPLPIPDTGGWQTWTTVAKPGITVSAGLHVVRVSMDTSASNGSVGNLNWIRLTLDSDRGDWTVFATESAPQDPPSNAIDGNPNTRFSTGAAQHDSQGFIVSWPGDRTIARIRMDAGPSTNDYPRACGMWVKDTAGTVTFVSCVPDAHGNVDVSFSPIPATTIEVWQWGTSTWWWSIAEFNVF